jgi:hypothetical protein
MLLVVQFQGVKLSVMMAVLSIGRNVSMEFAGLGFKTRRVNVEGMRVIKLSEEALDCEDSEHLYWVLLNNELDWI